ncbi:MAG: STAS domain-containing protein [Bacteroidales bacterium]
MPVARISGFEFHYSITDDYAIVRPETPCHEEGTTALASLVNSELIESKNLIIDLSHTNYVETPGYRWILRQMKILESEGRKLVVVNLPESVQRAFKLLKLDNVIPCAKSVDEAFEIINDKNLAYA